MADNPIILGGNLNNTSTITNSVAGGSSIASIFTLTANIVNSGSITETGGASADSILIVSPLTGSITNSGTISESGSGAPGDAILIDSAVSGGITNSGAITAAGAGKGIEVEFGNANITNQSAGTISGGTAVSLDGATTANIANAGLITSASTGGGGGVYTGGVLGGSITNTGTINVTGGASGTQALAIHGNVSGGISNSGTISSNAIGATGAVSAAVAIFDGSVTLTNQIGGIILSSGAGGTAIDFINGDASGTVTNAGTISQSAGGTAIDFSGSSASNTLTNTGAVTGAIRLSAQADVVTIKGGTIAGDILATAGGHGTVNITESAGSTFTAGGKIGDLNGLPLAAININSGTLSVGASGMNAAAITVFSGATLVTTAADTITGSLTNNGTIEASAGELTFQSLLGTGTYKVDAGAALNLTGGALGSSVTVAFQGMNNVKTFTGSLIQAVSASASSVTVSAVLGEPNTVTFSGLASQYGFTPTGDGIGLTVTGQTTSLPSSEHLSNILGLQFSDYTDLVASQTPLAGAVVSSAMLTELYGAVFGRTPDVAGLAFYQATLLASPSTPFIQFAEWFLASPEYTHVYPQTTAGDAQFITDSYNNLLHRTPAASEIAFYQNNVIAPAIAGLTPGTTAYTNAETQAHAQLLVYFSQSPEFLGDVQITSVHPPDATHWLILI